MASMKYGIKSRAVRLALVVILQFVTVRMHGQSLPTQLYLVVVRGEGAINTVGQRANTEPVIRVEDEQQRPINGATVVFTLPTEGATGEFGKGAKTLTVVTDKQGQAAAQGLRVNPVAGKLQIHINASYRGLRARTNVTQFNQGSVAAKAGTGKIVAILAIAGAAAAGGAILALKKGSPAALAGPPVVSTPALTPIGITAGTGTIAPPH